MEQSLAALLYDSEKKRQNATKYDTFNNLSNTQLLSPPLIFSKSVS